MKFKVLLGIGLAVLTGGLLSLSSPNVTASTNTASVDTTTPVQLRNLEKGSLDSVFKKNLQTVQPLRKFARGAKKTPFHKLIKISRHVIKGTTPAQFGNPIPTQLSMWGNDQIGDCVSAEEAAAKAFWSASYCGLTETFIPEATLVNWANQYGYGNGATLTDPMDTMISKGISVNGTTYYDGQYSTVDYTNAAVLQNAITVGPVKIGIDADALPSSAGQGNGWYSTGGSPGQFSNEDHCVGLYAYGSPQFVFSLMGMQVPAGFKGTGTVYMLYTWSTVGVVDFPWIQSTCEEAYVRNPTTPGQSPTPAPTPTPPNPNPPNPNPHPPVPPTPTPVPPVNPTGWTITIPSIQIQVTPNSSKSVPILKP